MSTQILPQRRWIIAALLAFALLLAMAMMIQLPLTTASSIPRPVSQVGPLSPSSDLLIQSITLDPPAPGADQEFDINVKVKNDGDKNVTTSFRVYLYVDPADQPPTGTTADTTWWSIFGLNAEATVIFTRIQETISTSGWHDIYAWVDKANSVAEANENNNLEHIRICIGGDCSGDDSYEDDNSCGTAKPISINGPAQTHTMSPLEDEDWVYFDGVANVTYVIESVNVGEDANTVLSLVNQCGAPPGFGGGQRIVWTAPVSGKFYLKMEHHDVTYDAAKTEYTVSVTAQDDCSADTFEVDDACAAARDISTTTSAQRHFFCSSGDVDWVKFSATSGTAYTIEAKNVGADADVMLSLLSQCGGPPGFGGGQRIEWVCPVDGIYYVKAENHDPGKYGAAASYDISISSGGACAPDGFEDDDDASSAESIVVGGGAQTHTFCPAADQDWVKFDAIQGANYTIETSNLGSESDTYIDLYDTDGQTRIAWDDDGGAGGGSRISWSCPANGTYYLMVRHHDTSAAGTNTQYDLTVSTVACQPDEYEDDDSHLAAKTIPSNDTAQDHDFCGAGDADWVKFTAQAGANYVIKTFDLGSSCDTTLYLFAPDGATQLAGNDDYDRGMQSRVDFVFSQSGTYYVKVSHAEPSQYGTGTDYKISVKQGSEPPPSVTPTVTPTPTATPPPSQIKTLILVNGERIEHYYGSGAANSLMAKLDDLAQDGLVEGVVVQVEDNTAVAQAYTAWNTDVTNTDKANAVASAVRNLVLSYLNGNASIEYVVIVGDDRIIPFRRTLDRTNYPEHNYGSASLSTTIGSACGDDMTLTDDYYVDLEPISWAGHELYLPDRAIGRLIETPTEIQGMINEFLANGGQTDVGKALVTGYDFVQDAAQDVGSLFKQDIGTANVDTTLIGTTWTGSQLRGKQLEASPRFDVQSINGHANHWTEGAPGAGSVLASDIAAASGDLSGVLIYTLGCHSGLNVPPDNGTYPLDLAQAFAQRRASYVGNTGYGWGVRGLVGLSERLMVNFTQALLSQGSATIGKALQLAKQAYYQQTTQFSDYDEKILIESTLYGLPMYQLNTGTVLGDEDPFAGDVTFGSGGQSVTASEGASVSTIGFSLNNSFGTMPLESHPDGFGDYFALSGYTSNDPLAPAQPLYFRELEPPAGQQVRGLILIDGHYADQAGFDPAIGLAQNEFTTTASEPDYDDVGWHPAVPFSLFRPNNNNAEATLLFSMGQYNVDGAVERLYDGMTLDVYYSDSPDLQPPIVRWVGGVRVVVESKAYIKVEAEDSSGVQRVNVAYTKETTGQWYSQDLAYNEAARKWLGSFPAGEDTVCFVQVVDQAGNVTIDTNKGSYYQFAAGEAPFGLHTVYLPVVLRGH